MISSSKNERVQDAQERVGEVLRGKYQLDGLLGVGGMASVYAATHRNGNRVAIKILHREAALSPTLRSRFLREGYLANRVDHPGAVSVIDDDFDETGTAYLVMELLSGENFEDRCEHLGGRLAVAEVLFVAHQVLEVLTRAHGKNIVHRDLKPSNLFLERGGCIKVLDFGIARLYTPSSGPGETAGAPLGTPGFMPPEQARGRSEDVGPHSDLWALGATMFYFLTGEFVHPAVGTVSEQLVAAMNEPAAPLDSVRRDLPERVRALVDRALAFSPSERWPSAAAMREEVATAYLEVTGNEVRKAPRLSLACPPPEDDPMSSDPEAPTVEATTGRAHVRTGTPVSAAQRSRGSRGSRSSWLLAAVIAGGLAFTGGTIAALRLASPTNGQPSKGSAVERPSAPAVASSGAPESGGVATLLAPQIVPIPSASAAEAEEEPAPAESTVPEPAPAPSPRYRAPARTGFVRSPPKPSPSSTPKDPIDIFSRRR